MATFGFFFPVVAGQHGQSEALEALKGQSLGDWTCGLVSAVGDAAEAERVAKAAGDARIVAAKGVEPTIAAMLNKGLADGAAFVAVLPAGVVLVKDALKRLAEEFGKRPNASCLYSSYSEKKPDGSSSHVTIYPHEGAPHERFDFGYLKVYRTAHLKEIGGLRTDLVHAAEYDADLKLCDTHSLEVVGDDLYVALLPPETGGAAPSGLYSPGKGKYGGFSYVFYPEDLEKEITGVFEQMLKRRGAWIDHDSVPVPYPERPYRVKASVVIPILNRERFIGNAIQKVIDGTFQDFEVIVIDNGSTDRTPEVVRAFTQKDPRIKLILQKGPSISYALNTGIRMAAGKYICQLDSDDEYAPETLEKMVGHFESHPKCGLAISYYELMEEDGSKVEGVAPVTHSGYTRNQILRRDGAGALRVFPKVVLEEMGYYDEANFGNFGEDYDMVLKVGEKYDVDRVHAVLYRYRRHPDNTDVTRDPLMKVQNKNNARLNALQRRKAINKKLGKA